MITNTKPLEHAIVFDAIFDTCELNQNELDAIAGGGGGGEGNDILISGDGNDVLLRKIDTVPQGGGHFRVVEEGG